MSCDVGSRHGLDLALLWYRLAAAALIQPLAWELPYAMGTALKKKKKKKIRYIFSVQESDCSSSGQSSAQCSGPTVAVA